MTSPPGRDLLDHPTTGRGIRWRRYTAGARVYDAVSLEWPIYGAGRREGMHLLAPAPGEHILDIGCGTGLNLPLLAPAVGPHGLVTGVDASPQMLDRARARVARRGWTDRVRLRQADAGGPGTGASWVERPVDAVVFTYALSVIPRWRQAFDNALAAARPGARILVVDLALPTGRARPASPLARLACWAGGADPHRQPWQALLEHTGDVEHRTSRGGHVHALLGHLPDR
jgi:S-adenosylmethionine-diacylgycerolhomoserine-N-methlytransferase